MKGRLVVYVLAAAAGIALALPFDRPAPLNAEPPRVAAAASEAVASKSVGAMTPVRMNGAAPSSLSPRVYASPGLELAAFHVDDVFVGYTVVRSHDPRLSVGDVVTAVGGEPVEEGAAGSELLIAALRNPEADITLQQSTDWSPAL